MPHTLYSGRPLFSRVKAAEAIPRPTGESMARADIWGTSMDAVRLVEGEVRELIRRRGLDPARQLGEVQLLVHDAVADYEERSVLGVLPPLGRLDAARKQIYDAVAGFGALQPLLDDPTIEEIWINAPV